MVAAGTKYHLRAAYGRRKAGRRGHLAKVKKHEDVIKGGGMKRQTAARRVAWWRGRQRMVAYPVATRAFGRTW